MPDFIGNVPVPEITPSGVFPLVPDYGYGQAISPQVVVHQFENTLANRKIEQRYYAGPGLRRFFFQKARLTNAERISLRNFFESRAGPYEPFTYNAPNPDPTTTTAYTVRFANPALALQAVNPFLLSVSLEFVEHTPVAQGPYSISATLSRFPSGTLATALTSQVQTIIPLLKIQPRESGYPAIYLSDRRVQAGANTYLPRLIKFQGIEQSINGQSDSARFTFGDADRVMSLLSEDTNLWLADLEFSLFHVGSTIKLDLWKGEIVAAHAQELEFSMEASDGIHALGLAYPNRRISRTCWKKFNDGNACPAASAGGTNLATPCDKGFDTAEGCQFHNMANYFGGIVAKPQQIRTKDNSTGVKGYGRSSLTSSSIVADSVYEQVLPEVYTDSDFPITAKVIAGRDEGDFYAALGIVGLGPLGQFAPNNFTGSPQVTPHLLDGQPPHGAVSRPPRNDYGFRASLGPTPNTEPFSLGEGGAGIQTYGPQRAAGTAFVEIRRSDEKGLQLSKLEEHSMQVKVSNGLSGFTWTGPGSRSTGLLTNPIWIVVNLLLRARGLQFASASVQEQFFDVQAAVDAAAICDTSVTKIIGAGSETQYKFRGVIQEQKPLRDWMQEVLNTCLGYFTIAFGKLRLGIRVNSAVAEAFTEGNILADSLQPTIPSPEFNKLTGVFADEEFDYVSNSVEIYDSTHAELISPRDTAQPEYRPATMNFVGVVSKSHTARLVITRLREELGGITAQHFKRLRTLDFKTTVLSLAVEPGMICSMTHARMPGGSGEFRVTRWRLNPDYSIDIQGRTTVDEMYDYTVGPKPADVTAGPIPDEVENAPEDWSFLASTKGNGYLDFSQFACAVNSGSVHRANLSIYYVDEETTHLTRVLSGFGIGETTGTYNGDHIPAGSYILIRGEIIYVSAVNVTSPANGTVTIARAQFGTSEADHSLGGSSVTAVNPDTNAEFTMGTGIILFPGDVIVRVTPGGDPSVVTEYDPSSGLTRVVLPPTNPIAPGHIVDTKARIYLLKRRDITINFQPRFFRSPERINFEHREPMPKAAVAAVVGTLENTRGLTSEEYIVLFTGAYPYKARTLGTTAYQLYHPELPLGSHPDVFEEVEVVAAQTPYTIYAEAIAPLATGSPIPIPPAPSSIAPGGRAATGSILVGGTVAAGNQIQVSIGDATLDPDHVFILPFTITTESTTADVATALASWLNTDEQFAARYTASPSASTVNIFDNAGVGGEITCAVSGSITATPTGMSPALGVITGRRYAVTFRRTSTGHETDVSPLSVSTGHTGSHDRVDITIPISSHPDVDQRRVWAILDGADERGPYYLVATVSNNTATLATDTITEATLSAQTQFNGEFQPTQPGVVIVTVKGNGKPYCLLKIDSTLTVSNVIRGECVPPLVPGMVIDCDIVNNRAQEAFRVVLG